jgi:hypothetical protein
MTDGNFWFIRGKTSAVGVGVRIGAVDVGGDIDRAKAVGPADHRVSTAFLGHRDLAERDLLPILGADPHVGEILQTTTFLVGIADIDADLVAAALEALDFLAEEGLPDLPRDAVEPQPERLALRRD